MAGVKYPPLKAIGIRPCGEITPEMLATEEWKKHWYNENIIAAKSIGGRPKEMKSEQQVKAV